MPRHRSRREFPELYEREIPIVVPAGHVLVYSMSTFHRGSRIRASEGARFAQNIGFKRSDMVSCGQETFQNCGGRPEMDRFMERATPHERELVGFPPVGHAYWNSHTVAAVGRRYPGMDMSPYESGPSGRYGEAGSASAYEEASGLDDFITDLSSLPGTPQWRRRL